ncbi:MAG: DUF2269 family protein [Candidatus Limnocylindrales bacterium]
MASLVPWLIFIHVLSAIVAFGPTFAFGLYGAQAAGEPQHANFMARANHHVSDRLVLPVALSMPVSGLLLIWAAEIDLLAARWLLLAITVYVVAVLYAILVQRPAVIRLVELTSGPPPAGAAPSGPPPALLETAAKIRRGGMLTGGLIVVIVALMVVKPAF